MEQWTAFLVLAMSSHVLRGPALRSSVFQLIQSLEQDEVAQPVDDEENYWTAERDFVNILLHILLLDQGAHYDAVLSN